MCLLTYLPTGVQPNAERLENGACDNRDGHGFAIVSDGKLFVHRGLVARKVIDAFVAMRLALPHGPALFHSRYGTGGGVTEDNCHPYQVGDDNQTVVAHNGILFTTPRGESRSDTRIFAEEQLPKIGFRTARQRKALEKHVTRSNKLVILTVNRRYSAQAFLVNEREGNWDNDIWYSNYGYLAPRPPYAPTATERAALLANEPIPPTNWRWSQSAGTGWPPQSAATGWSEDYCDFCNSRGTVNAITWTCTACGACQDCGGGTFEEDPCQCYVPMALRKTKHVPA